MHPSRYGLIFLFLIAIIGTWLRAVHWLPVPLPYNHWVHAHSHVAFQGWVYVTLFLLLIHSFLNDTDTKKRFRWIFWATLVSVLGILVSFSLYGYGGYSIGFSLVFQLLSYVFMFRFWKNTRAYRGISVRWVRTGFGFGVLSSIIPFFIGFLSARGLSGTEWYQAAVFSFLHFQHEGWFLFMGIGLIYKLFENKGIAYPWEKAQKGLVFSALGTFLGTTLTYLGLSLLPQIYAIAILSLIFKGIGLGYFLRSLPKKGLLVFSEHGWSRQYVFVFFGALLLKTLLQILSVIPRATEVFFNNKYLILAYLHLSLIGVISCLLLALMHYYRWIADTKISRWGNGFLMVGFVVSEILLVTGGLGVFFSPELLLIASASMAIGIFCLILSPIQNKYSLWKRTNGSP